MASIDAASDQASGIHRGQAPTGDEESSRGGSVGISSAKDGDHLGSGHPERISLKDLEGSVLDAFSSGDPELVYNLVQQLLGQIRSLSEESAQLRFRLNFGTSVCGGCDGLKAGPGVVATCFQVKLCNYTNVKDTPDDPKKLRLLHSMLK